MFLFYSFGKGLENGLCVGIGEPLKDANLRFVLLVARKIML